MDIPDLLARVEGSRHLGDPCKFCGVGHDDVPPGPCLGARASTLGEILKRVEAATGPSREIDCYLEAFVARFEPEGRFVTVGPPGYDPPRLFYNPMPAVDWIGYDLLIISPAYTTSIDAAVALIERVVGGRQPGWTYNCKAAYDGRGSYNWFEITWPSTECQGRGRTMALAACASLLRAVQRDPALLRAKIATGEGSSECKL